MGGALTSQQVGKGRGSGATKMDQSGSVAKKSTRARPSPSLFFLCPCVVTASPMAPALGGLQYPAPGPLQLCLLPTPGLLPPPSSTGHHLPSCNLDLIASFLCSKPSIAPHDPGTIRPPAWSDPSLPFGPCFCHLLLFQAGQFLVPIFICTCAHPECPLQKGLAYPLVKGLLILFFGGLSSSLSHSGTPSLTTPSRRHIS